ncbi:MAG: hypothetical protein GXP15_03950 [Gammaproteobacteria bacterium]|nr:hypothetical protein [Gammaproteobacteria bacterium]
MNSVNSTSLASFQTNSAQLKFRPESPPAQKAEPAHQDRDRVESDHGRGRAAQIFRQEMIQSLKIKFDSAIKLSISAANPYKSNDSAESVAADVVTSARTIAEQGSAEPARTLAKVRQSVAQAVSISQKSVETTEGKTELDVADGLIQRGLDELEKDTRLVSASSFAVEARSKQRSTIKIQTQEGDIVKFDLRRVDRLSASDVAIQTDSGSASLTEISVSSKSRLVLKVEGDLNSAELDAIKNVFAQAEKLAEEFFAGDLNAALEVVAGLEFDTSQLARVSMKFRSNERISIQQTTLQNAPVAAPAASPTSPDPAAVPTAAPIVAPTTAPTAAPTTPVIALPSLETIATPDAPVVNVTPEAVPGTDKPTGTSGLFSGFASLVNYLGKIADYLEETVDQFSNSLQGSETTSMRFEVTESVRLDILRAVMIETAPAPKEGQEATTGDAIRQLDEDQH